MNPVKILGDRSNIPVTVPAINQPINGLIKPNIIIVFDEFSGVNGTLLSSHSISPINKPAASWTGPRWQINSNKAKLLTGFVTDTAILDCKESDIKITAIVNGNWNTSSARMDLVFRYSDSSNYWRANTAPALNVYQILEINGGASITRASGSFTFSKNTDYQYKLIANGQNIQFSINGNSISYNSATFNINETIVGILGERGQNEISFDNFKVTKL